MARHQRPTRSLAIHAAGRETRAANAQIGAGGAILGTVISGAGEPECAERCGEEGAADGTDLSGIPVALASRYSDDEPGSPWTWILYLDARASSEQRTLLERIFTGRLGGDAERHFPWAWKPSELVAVRAVEIEVDHARRRQWLRIRDRISVRIRDRYDGGETVTCVIPGHGRTGEELVADELTVEDGAIAFDYRGVCGYGSSFDYAG